MSRTNELNEERRQALAGRSNIGPVGLIWARQAPKKWKVTTLQRLFTVSSGDFLSPGDLQEDGYPVFGGNGFRGYFSNINCPPNTMLIGRYGALCGNVHIPSEPFWATEHAFRVRPLLQYHQPFVARYVEALALRHLAARAAQPGLNSRMVREQAIALPDLATQHQIADFLDRETARIDLLIEKKQRLVALLGEKYEATAAQLSTGERCQEQKLETGIDWLGLIPKSWSVEKLSWNFYAAKGKDAQKYTKEYCAANEGEYPVYSGQTSNEGVMGRIDTFDYDFGETGVLFATTVGAKAMDLRHLRGRFSLSQNCMIIIPRQKIPLKFFLYQMRVLFRKERQLIPDHMQASFRVEDLYRYRIAMPPLDQASEIGAKIEKAEAAVVAVVDPVKASIDRLKEYRAALITAAVTGQIDVQTYARSGTTDRRLDAIQEEMGA